MLVGKISGIRKSFEEYKKSQEFYAEKQKHRQYTLTEWIDIPSDAITGAIKTANKAMQKYALFGGGSESPLAELLEPLLPEFSKLREIVPEENYSFSKTNLGNTLKATYVFADKKDEEGKLILKKTYTGAIINGLPVGPGEITIVQKGKPTETLLGHWKDGQLNHSSIRYDYGDGREFIGTWSAEGKTGVGKIIATNS